MCNVIQVCKAGVARVRKIWLTRHGESEYNQHELLGGDSLLSPNGEIYARLLPDALVDRVPLVSSTLEWLCTALSPYRLQDQQCMSKEHAQVLNLRVPLSLLCIMQLPV